MLIAAWVLAAAHGVLSVAGLFTAVRRKNQTGENVVWLPFFVVAIVMVCGTILSIPTVVCAMDGDWMFALFGTVVLASICMMTAYLNCVIWYDDEGFVARNFFGIRRSCSYAEVDGVKGRKDRKIYFNGYCIMIDEISIGADEFMDALYKGYRKATGRHVPSFKPKWDPMNGHLEHPWGYFILWITLLDVRRDRIHQARRGVIPQTQRKDLAVLLRHHRLCFAPANHALIRNGPRVKLKFRNVLEFIRRLNPRGVAHIVQRKAHLSKRAHGLIGDFAHLVGLPEAYAQRLQDFFLARRCEFTDCPFSECGADEHDGNKNNGQQLFHSNPS